MSKPKKLSREQIEASAQNALDDALDFNETEIAPDRLKAQRYFTGEVDLEHEEGRSKVVATKVRDVIRAVKPSLMRVFLSTDKPVEYVPIGSEDAPVAEQATTYMHVKYNQLGGYTLLNDAIHDALIKKTGIIKVFWDETEKRTPHTFSNLTDEELMVLLEDDDLEVLEAETVTEVQEIPAPETGVPAEAMVGRHKVTVIRIERFGKLAAVSVPPEEFVIDRNATCIEDAFVVAHRTEMRVGDLVAMGIDFEKAVELTPLNYAESMNDAEQEARQGYEEEEDQKVIDPSMKMVAVAEVYMKLDVDGTGVPMLHKLLMGGGDNQLLEYEPWDEIPFAVFEVDPEPHTFYGRSLADLIIEDQDVGTALLRGVLDNVAMTNNPREEVVEDNVVDMDEVLNNEIGAIVRVTQAGSINPLVVPFVAGQTLSAVQYFDQVIEEKTGITKASTGLHPDALQSTTATAVAATVSAQAAQIEVIARNLAEGGLRRLFKLLLKLAVENTPQEEEIRVHGSDFVPMDPRSWNTAMDVSVNVGLGTGKEDQKQAALGKALDIQMGIWQNYGPGNGLVTMTNMRNTLADMLALNGLRNTNRYFQPMDPQREQQLIASQQQAAQGQGQGGGEAEAYSQTELGKAQIKAQVDRESNQMDAQLKMLEMMRDDDLSRDEMDQELLLKAAELLGQHGVAVDTNRIKALQNAPREPINPAPGPSPGPAPAGNR